MNELAVSKWSNTGFKTFKKWSIEMKISSPVSLAQLAGIVHYICRGSGFELRLSYLSTLRIKFVSTLKIKFLST
jgi:hypothetical protein